MTESIGGDGGINTGGGTAYKSKGGSGIFILAIQDSY